MQESMEKALDAAFAPMAMQLVNESAKHRGHAGVAEAGDSGNTHFRLEIVAKAFAGKSRVERHRMIYAALGDAFDRGMHALAIDAKAPGE